ncbi:MAG: transporter [Pseudomonadota bacterium]|nr:transporter [Pseudomonadota bacterium]
MSGYRAISIGVALVGILALAGAALAQETPAAAAPPPDKSGFTLFDPTPAADLRALCTDRPTKSASPCTVDAGHVQIESDLVNVTYDRSGGANTTTWLATNPTVKLGLTNALDAELNIVPLEIVTVRDRATGATSRTSGVGDLYARLKWNLLGDDGGAIGLAISPFVKLPTAKAGIGDGAVETGVAALISVNLPDSFSLNVNPEIDLLRNAQDSSRHINTIAVASLNRPVSKTITLSAELWSDVNFDPAGRITQVSADLGAAWIPARHQNFQLDGGVNLGLNDRTPAVQAYVGASRRF